MFSVHNEHKADVFKFPRFEERFRKAPFLGRTCVDGRPNCRNKAGKGKGKDIDSEKIRVPDGM